MNPVDSSDLSRFRATGEEQKTGSRITDLPKDLLGKIFELLPPKNLFPLAHTSRTFREISKTTLEEKEKKFVEQKNKLTAFLKKILNKVTTDEVFTKEIETFIKDSPNLDWLREFLKNTILKMYGYDGLWPVPYFIRGVREHTELEDFSTIEFLDEVLHEYSPIFHLEEKFWSQIPLKSVDRLVERRIQKYGFEQTYKDLLRRCIFGGFSNPVPLLFHSRRLLVRHAENGNCRTEEFSKRFNDEKSFVLDILKRQGDFFHGYASDRLKKDKDIVLAILKNKYNRPLQPSKYVPPELQDDPEIKALLEKYPDQKEFPD